MTVSLALLDPFQHQFFPLFLLFSIKMLFPCEDVCSIFFGTIFPILGGITSTLLGLSTLPAVLEASQTRDLKQLNILPLAILFISASVWLLYSYIVSNYYIFFSNIINVGSCLFYVLTCLPLETRDRQKLITRLMVFLTGCLLSVGAVCFITFKDDEAVRVQIMGWAGVIMLLVFYTSPLSTLMTVIKTKTSDSIHLYLSIASIINGKLCLMIKAPCGQCMGFFLKMGLFGFLMPWALLLGQSRSCYV
jgi:solute carrier family 50 (sugar transporter)